MMLAHHFLIQAVALKLFLIFRNSNGKLESSFF
jgi:hypothetical protein